MRFAFGAGGTWIKSKRFVGVALAEAGLTEDLAEAGLVVFGCVVFGCVVFGARVMRCAGCAITLLGCERSAVGWMVPFQVSSVYIWGGGAVLFSGGAAVGRLNAATCSSGGVLNTLLRLLLFAAFESTGG